jgi:glycosyltransferase involved in cell wall biosynthesis
VSDRKLVSAVCGSFERPDMLAELIENIRAQTYRPLELCVAVEPSEDEAINEEYRVLIESQRGRSEATVPIKWAMLGRHWSSFLANSISAVPFQVAQWLSGGSYLLWAADDERFVPGHVEKLVNLLEAEDADFAYPLQGCYWRGALNRTINWIGTDPPRYGQITHALYRAELLDYRGFEINVGSGTDWDQVYSWMQAGARWAFLREKTMTHRVDKAGDGDARRVRQPLRGHTPNGRDPRALQAAEVREMAARKHIKTDCWTCGGPTRRVCWCHNTSGGSDNSPCRCSATGLLA